jgi:hypothetical protein
MSLRILEALPRSSFLSAITDRASPLYAPRAGIELLHKAGYIDCYRHVNPLKPGFTCPASAVMATSYVRSKICSFVFLAYHYSCPMKVMEEEIVRFFLRLLRNNLNPTGKTDLSSQDTL